MEVVDLAGGWADTSQSRPWTTDTLVHTYSASKPFAALTALTAVAEGTIGLDEPIGSYWTEYATAGKQRTTLRDILTHRAGLPAFPAAAHGVDLLDDDALRAALAAAPAESVPGSTLAEHALTYGHLIDGVLRAATGHTLGETYSTVVRPALGIDAWFGVPDRDLARVADLEHALAGGAGQFLGEIAPSYERVLSVPEGALGPRPAQFGAVAPGGIRRNQSARVRDGPRPLLRESD